MRPILIPTTILKNRNFSVLESLVKYLKEKEHLNFAEIGRLLERDQRNIWTIYSRVKEKNV